MNEITSHIIDVKALCLANGVKSLFAFGSITRNAMKEDSDIDLVVEIDNDDPLRYANSYFNLKFGLEALFRREIDLLEKKALKNKYLKEQIENTKVLVYEAAA
jgi:predicted nucleotidyltransferase